MKDFFIFRGFIINKNGVSVETENIITIKLKITCCEYLPEIMKVKNIILFSKVLEIQTTSHGKYFWNVSEYLLNSSNIFSVHK